PSTRANGSAGARGDGAATEAAAGVEDALQSPGKNPRRPPKRHTPMAPRVTSMPMKKPIIDLIIDIGIAWGMPHLQSATGTLLPAPWFLAQDNNGNPINNAKVCFYVAGTSTLATTYSDVTLLTPNANPLRADAAGRVGPIYLTPGQSYKLV